MGKVTSNISMSLDGFITGPNVSVGNEMGDDGDRLHDWRFDAKTETDAAIVDEIYASTGAVLIAKRMFDVGFEPWGDPPPFGDAGIHSDSRRARASAHAGRYDLDLLSGYLVFRL
jgi:hypothetical protein